MPHDVRQRRLVAGCILAWSLVMAVIAGRLLFGPPKGSVYPTFARAGADWLAAADLYNHTDALYRYSPLVAALFTPFSLLPDRLAEVLWRLVNVGVYLAALGWWQRTSLPRTLSRSQVAVLFLLALPLSIGSLNNGQSNALVLGLLLMAVAAVTVERWNLSAVSLALAVSFKIYPLAIALLLVLAYPRRLGWRFALALAASAAAPFLLQDSTYVAGQYASWFHYLQGDQRIDIALTAAGRDLRLICRLAGLGISPAAYAALQLLGAAGVAALVLAGRYAQWPERRLLTALLAWGSAWMLLLGPATESCTYILLAPSLAWATLDAWAERKPWPARGLLAISWSLFTLALVANWFPFAKNAHTLGLQPLGVIAFLGSLAADLPTRRRPHVEAAPQPVAKAA